MHESQSIKTQPLGKAYGNLASEILLGTVNILVDSYSFKSHVFIIRLTDVKDEIRLCKQ
jgi:hypothetical protein